MKILVNRTLEYLVHFFFKKKRITINVNSIAVIDDNKHKFLKISYINYKIRMFFNKFITPIIGWET